MFSTYTQARGQHAGCYDQVGKDEAGHAEGEKDLFSGICVIFVSPRVFSPPNDLGYRYVDAAVRNGMRSGVCRRMKHTGMESRVDELLGLPQVGRHGLDLSLLVGDEELLSLLETSIANEKRPANLARTLARHSLSRPESSPSLPRSLRQQEVANASSKRHVRPPLSVPSSSLLVVPSPV